MSVRMMVLLTGVTLLTWGCEGGAEEPDVTQEQQDGNEGANAGDIVETDFVIPPPPGPCQNDADLVAIGEAGAQTPPPGDRLGACVLEMFASGADLAECLAEIWQVSDECLVCFVNFANCGVESCLEVCASNDGNEVCSQCSDENCVPGFQECAGVDELTIEGLPVEVARDN